MSKGFVSEYDDQWLHEIMPTMNALLRFLKLENNGITIYEKRNYIHDKTGKPVYEMSNGLSYSVNDKNQWYVVEE
ncbi:MAG: hypothetical protein JST49_09235 [Bacteroidetes bacterium]|nr:hypothetical protein [Bacteroidota bacterium]